MQPVLPKLWPSSLHLHLTSQRWIPTQGPLCVTLLTPNSLNDSLSTSTCSSFFEIGKYGPTQAGTWHPERLHCEVSLLKRWTLPLYQKSEDEPPDSKCHQNYFEISPLNIECVPICVRLRGESWLSAFFNNLLPRLSKLVPIVPSYANPLGTCERLALPRTVTKQTGHCIA